MLVLLIEDHPIVRAGCRRVLAGRERLDIVEASNAADGLHMAREHRPDVIVLDLNLPDASGLDLLRELSREREAKILVFSMYEDPAFVARALESGAAGYLTKNDDPDTLLDAIERVTRGEVHLGHTVAQKLALMHLRPDEDPLRDLSPRERQVLDLLGAGCSLSDIAARLDISYRTVANISSQLKSKLRVPNAAALIKLAVEQRRAGAV